MKRITRKLIRDYGITIVIALGFSFLIRGYVIEAYRIPSASMSPTLLSGDILFVAKWPFRLTHSYTPQRGDIIVFSAPEQEDSENHLDFVKRIVGIPGDRITISKGILKINDQATSDSLAPPACATESLPNSSQHQICFGTPILEDFGPEQVPPQSVFVLGDLRVQPTSKKRKGWGITPLSAIKGRALWIGLSIDNSPRSHQIRWDRIFRRID